MDISGRVNGAVKQAAMWAGLGIVSLVIILAGIGFLISSAYIWLTYHMNKAEAAASTGGGMIVLAVLLLLIGGAIVKRAKKRRPSMAQEFRNTIGLATRLFTLVVARDPKKALIVSLVAGALAEFITSEKRK